MKTASEWSEDIFAAHYRRGESIKSIIEAIRKEEREVCAKVVDDPRFSVQEPESRYLYSIKKEDLRQAILNAGGEDV